MYGSFQNVGVLYKNTVKTNLHNKHHGCHSLLHGHYIHKADKFHRREFHQLYSNQECKTGKRNFVPLDSISNIYNIQINIS